MKVRIITTNKDETLTEEILYINKIEEKEISSQEKKIILQGFDGKIIEINYKAIYYIFPTIFIKKEVKKENENVTNS